MTTRDIDLYSSSFCGLSTFGMMVIHETLVPLSLDPNIWKFLTTLVILSLRICHDCLMKFKLNPSILGLLDSSHSKIAPFTSSYEISFIRSSLLASLALGNSMLPSFILTLLCSLNLILN